MPPLSIIVPIYNCEQHIEKCVRSLMEQTLPNIQYIFINDNTQDNSIAKLENILKEYPFKNVTIRHNRHNLGPSASRNIGLNLAKGQYVAFCDSDDYVHKSCYETLYTKAILSNADIVICDINIESHEHCTYFQFPSCTSDKNRFLKTYIASYWTPITNLIIKKNFVTNHSLSFPNHIRYCEDFYFIIKTIYFANTIEKVNIPLYTYNCNNSESIMHNLSSVSGIDDRLAYLAIVDFFEKNQCIELYEKEISWRILNSFHLEMYKLKAHKEITSIYPTCHKYILSNPFYNKRQKQLMWLLTHNCRWVVVIFLSIRKILGRNDD